MRTRNDPDLIYLVPDDVLEPLTKVADEIVLTAATSAIGSDPAGRLRPKAWLDLAEGIRRRQEAPVKVGGSSFRTRQGCPPQGRPGQAPLLMLGLPDTGIGVGSSIPRELFVEMAGRTGVPAGSMPEVGEAVAKKAGLAWAVECDSRASTSGIGSTVTAVGLERLVKALQHLL